MSEIGQLIVFGIILGLAGAAIWWLFIASEGVYLGRRAVVWLYDLYANRYDRVKNYVSEYERLYLADPILEGIAPATAPLILDVATGTGRLPLALARHPDFNGHVIGVDLSRRMLHQAANNLRVYDHCTSLIWCPAEALPFENDTFDVVACLEALEFMTNPQMVVEELARVLRPGGMLLVTQRINTRLMPGKVWSAGEFVNVLEQHGIEYAHAQIWQVDYRKVWGRKRGESHETGKRPLWDVLRCPSCGQKGFLHEQGCYSCQHCGISANIGNDGVLEMNPLYSRQRRS